MRPTVLRCACVAAALLLTFPAGAQQPQKPAGGGHEPVVRVEHATVTPVEGPSWLKHLGLTFENTAMGKVGTSGAWGPTPTESGQTERYIVPSDLFHERVTLSGSDLFRLNCEACHGPKAEGLPPEINSMIGPVQATSPELIEQRTKRVGSSITPAAARQLAAQSENLLLQRLAHGGQKMPAFPHLTPVEVKALLAYINMLAGVPGAQNRQMKVDEPSVLAGEHLVKGTCHICHDATGRYPTPQELLQGAIPPLATMPSRKGLGDFIRKVTQGAPIAMGPIPTEYRGRMPVFYYLRPEDVANAYFYLILYPPRQAGAATEHAATPAHPPAKPRTP